MDGGSIPPSSTITYALTRGYAKNRAGLNPPATKPKTAGQPLDKAQEWAGFYRISTAWIDGRTLVWAQ